jgi:asparagine synthase (glutamine-hydrolysing)
MDRTFEVHGPSAGIYLLPGADKATIERERAIQVSLGEREHRVILSGMGGDELLGGVPTGTPELANYLVAGEFSELVQRAVRWCLIDRTPLLHLLRDTVKYVIELYTSPRVDEQLIPPWIEPRLQRLCRRHAKTQPTCGGELKAIPSSVANGRAWWSIMETLPHIYPGLLSRPEYRYPLLDKQLIDFLFSIPREQLVRPGRRRSLMRRALQNIVPDEILERRRKAYQIRGPLAAMQQSRGKIESLFDPALVCLNSFVDQHKFLDALDLTGKGRDIRWLRTIMRAVAFELWLRGHCRQEQTRWSLT